MQEDYLDKGLPIPGDYTLEDIKANDHADALAQEAAKRQQVMLQIASDYLYYYARAKSFQRRFIDIIQSLPKRNFSKLSPIITPPPTPLEDYYQTSPHHIKDSSNRLTCKNCYNTISKNLPKPELIEFCKSPCSHPYDRAGPTPIGTVKIGKTSTHQSHKLRMYKGLFFCNNCGNFTQGKLLKSLNQPCEEPKPHGKYAKKRISQGNLPYGLQLWPADNPTSLFYSIIKIPTKGLTQLDVEQQIQEITQACPPSPTPLQHTTSILHPNDFDNADLSPISQED
jgi:hypothetical protein